MIYHLTLTDAVFRQLVDGLSVNPGRTAVCPASVSRLPDRLEFLVHTVRREAPRTQDTTPQVMVSGAESVVQLTTTLGSVLSSPSTAALSVYIALGIGAAAGYIAGACRTPRGIEPVQTLTIVGPRLPRIRLQSAVPDNGITYGQSAPTHEGYEDVTPHAGSLNQDSARAIWSRTIGALGEAAWQRMTSLHCGIVGCGRTGSLVAMSLTRLGVQRLTLIDPDTLELHNLRAPQATPPHNWRQQRAGSLRSLNQLAVSLALRLLEDFTGGHLAGNAWLHLDINDAGIPTLEHRAPPPNPLCPLCALNVYGDAGVPLLSRVLGSLGQT